MSTEVPPTVRRASSRFAKQRGSYYEYVAALLKGSGGSIKPMTMFERDIQRFAGKPRGVLSEYWLDRYSANGGDLADAFTGTLPDDEIAIIRVSQGAGSDALLIALEDVARIAKLADKIKSESRSILIAGAVAATLALVMLTAFPVFSVAALKDAYSFLPLEAWGKTGKSYYAYSERVKAYGAWVFGAIVLSFIWLNWSIGNLVVPAREWLDRNIVLYRIVRDLKGAMFLSTMSTLSRKRGNVMFTLKQSLEMFLESVNTPWMRWRVQQIIDSADATGGVGVQAFGTGMLSEDMYFYLEDMQAAKGFSAGFEEAGRYVETHLLASIVTRLTFYRWLLLLLGVVTVVAMLGWQFSVLHEMGGAMKSYLATG